MCRVVVQLPSTLIQIAGGPARVEVRGKSLREALDDLVRRRPELGVHLFDETGRLRLNVLCLHDGVHSGRRETLDIPLKLDEEITIVQALSGG